MNGRSQSILGQPLVGPAGDDRLSRGMAPGMRIEGAVGTGFGSAAGPGAGINGIDRRVGCGEVGDKQTAEPLHIDSAGAQGGIKATPTSAVGRG